MKTVRIMIIVLGGILLTSLGYASQQMITRSDFFKDIVGFDEAFFREKDLKRKSYYFEKAPDGSFGVLSGFAWSQHARWADRKPGKGVGSHRRKAIFEGEFSAPTIATLKGQPSSIGQGNPGSFRILLHDPNNPQKTDIRALQADRSNNGAAFQLASTFFGPLEGGMYKWRSKLTDMTRSPVQGEEASISAAPATIYRKYFMALDPQHKQFRKDKFYLLYKLAHTLPMKLKPNGAPYVDAYRYVERKGDTDKVAVGIHHDIFVTSGSGGSGPNGQQVRLSAVNNPQRITQIFTSAYDTRFARGGSSAGYAKPLALNVQAASKMLLDGAYEGTIRAAASKNIKKLYLTLVGGGSFRNEIAAWIGDAIKKTKDLIKDSGMEVILVYRPDKVREKDAVQIRTAEKDRKFLESLAEIARDISGISYNKKYMADLITQYVSPFYNNQRPSPQVITSLQDLFDQLAQVAQVPPRTVTAVAQVGRPVTQPELPAPPIGRPVTQPKPSVPPKKAVAVRVSPEEESAQQPPQKPPIVVHVPAQREMPVYRVLRPQSKPIIIELAEQAPGAQPVQEETGFVSQAWQWVQSTWAWQTLSGLWRRLWG